MVHIGRCGSTVLGNLASRHPSIHWDGELYHGWYKGSMPADIRQKFEGPFDLLAHQSNACQHKVYGFEIKLQHLNDKVFDLHDDAFIRQLEKLRFNRFVILRRRNLLRQAISVARGQSSGQWHYESNKNPPQILPLTLDPDRVKLGGKAEPILDRFKAIESRFHRLASLLKSAPGNQLLELCYEDDIESDPLAGYRKLCNFCDLTPVETVPDLHRIQVRPSSELIENFDAIRQSLQGSEYQWMLELDGTSPPTR
jgi:LPS sulfotransferase NodH